MPEFTPAAIKTATKAVKACPQPFSLDEYVSKLPLEWRRGVFDTHYDMIQALLDRGIIKRAGLLRWRCA